MSFLKRTERVYPEYTSIVHGSKSFTWRQTAARCRRLASALSKRGTYSQKWLYTVKYYLIYTVVALYSEILYKRGI